MRQLKFFITRIFLKRWIIVIGMGMLLFLASYFIFIATRSVISTVQGYEEIKVLDEEGIFIANLDPDSEANYSNFGLPDTKKVYKHLDNTYQYALQVYGFNISLPNEEEMDVTVNYLNEEAFKINKLQIIEGTDIKFDYSGEEIPVLLGAGLRYSYPLGTLIEVIDPVTQQPVILKVQGILKKNTYRSNFYAPNSKNYFNFSVFMPINEDFISNAGLDLHVNGLMDLIIIDSNKDNVIELTRFIQDHLGLKFNFFNQSENFSDFKEYYLYSLLIISIVTLFFIMITIGLSIWNTLLSIRLMIKDFIINLLVGLSYSKLRKILYSSFGLLSILNINLLFFYTVYNRYTAWLRKDAIFATYGIGGLISMDWLALLITFCVNLVIVLIIVEYMMYRIKKIPISLGVLL